MKLLLDPHGDDAVLFASFVLQREKPDIAVVFDSHVQVRRGHNACDWETRRKETATALNILGINKAQIHFLGLSDDFSQHGIVDSGDVAYALKAKVDIKAVTDVWLPLYQTLAHKQHNLVSLAGSDIFRNTGANINFYSTYTSEGKSTSGEIIPPIGTEIRKKLIALSHFKTQIEIDALGCWPHFIRDQNEYITKFVRYEDRGMRAETEVQDVGR